MADVWQQIDRLIAKHKATFARVNEAAGNLRGTRVKVNPHTGMWSARRRMYGETEPRRAANVDPDKMLAELRELAKKSDADKTAATAERAAQRAAFRAEIASTRAELKKFKVRLEVINAGTRKEPNWRWLGHFRRRRHEVAPAAPFNEASAEALIAAVRKHFGLEGR